MCIAHVAPECAGPSGRTSKTEECVTLTLWLANGNGGVFLLWVNGGREGLEWVFVCGGGGVAVLPFRRAH